MAKKRNKRTAARNAARTGKTGSDEISPDILRGLWTDITPKAWMDFLQQNHPNSKWSWSNEGIQGCCPFHGEKTPSFKINFIRRQAKCFGGCDAYYWNPIHFYAHISSPRRTYADALTRIRMDYKPKGLPQRVVAHLTKIDRHRRMKNIVHKVTNTELVDAVSLAATDVDFNYAKRAVEYLHERGLPLVYEDLPIGVMPQLLRLKNLVTDYCQIHNEDVTLADDAVDYFKKYEQDTAVVGNLLFFYGGSPQHVSRIKLLQPPPKRDPREINPYTTKPKKVTSFVEDTLDPDLGVFGLYGVPVYASMLAGKNAKHFYFVEGEFDMLSIVAQQCHSTIFDFIVLAGSGGGHSGADLLQNFGFDECYIVADDDAAGETIVKGILEKSRYMPCRIFQWPQSLKSTDTDPKTDPDKALQQHGYTAVCAALNDINNFLMPYRWAYNQADQDMVQIHADDVRRLTNTAAAWGAFVVNQAERHKYVADIAKKFDLPTGPIWNEILNEDDTEQAFIQRMSDTLAQRFSVLSTLAENNRYIYQCWHHTSERIYNLPLEESRQLRAALANAEGKDLLRFVLEDVGEPGFEAIRFDDMDDEDKYVRRWKKYTEYLTLAVANLGRYVGDLHHDKVVNAGCHVVKPGQDTPDQEFTLYLVKGAKLFRGVYPTASKDRINFKQCDGPRDQGVRVFINEQFTPQDIHPQYPDAETLNADPAYTFSDMYNLIRDIIDTGWGFQKQETTVELLTAFLMLIPISDVVDRQPLIMFTGDQSSGKTSLIGGLIGGDALGSINILQNATFMANFTQAGVRQSMNYCPICLCLDEFEDKGGNDRVSTRVRDVLQLLRGLANDKAVTRYGSASGIAQETYLRFSVCAAGIRGLKDPADLSRFILIEMKRNLARQSPETALFDTFGEDTIVRIRHELPRLLYHHAYQIHESYRSVKKEFRKAKIRGLPPELNLTRTREMLYGLMAVMKYAGRDYEKFVTDYFQDYRLVLERLSKVSLSNDLFNALFHTPAVQIPSTSEAGSLDTLSISRILMEDKSELMNDRNVGVFYDKARNWLIVHWPTAAPSILRRSTYGGQADASPGYLKSHAARSQYHVADDMVRSSGVLQQPRVRAKLGDAQILHISVYNVRKYDKDNSGGMQLPQRSIKGRENEADVISFAERYKEALAKKQFPKPPPLPPQDAETEETATADSTGGVDDDFHY